MLKPLLSLLAALFVLLTSASAAEPLRIFIRSGPKTHGPGQHDHPRFLEEWTKLLHDRGATVTGANGWPKPEEFAKLDVIIVFAPDPWDVPAETRAAIDKFAERGGGFVVLHDGVCSHSDPAWVRSLIGGAWRYGAAKYFEGDLDFYYVQNQDPIVAGASNFAIRDEMYYDLDMHPDAEVLAATWTPDARAQQNGRAYPSVYNVAPQLWSFDDHTHRAFVDLLGHNYTTFEQPHVRAVLLRGIAWAGQRENVDEFCSKEELASLRYPAGGPSRPADELAKLEVHPDFTATLQASEPLVHKVIALDWDPSGRLWVAETPEYPNGRRGLRPDFAGVEWKDHGGLVAEPGKQVRPGQDRISILTSSKGGPADQKKVFYEGLELVTGFVFHRDGVIVCAAPDILWLRDTKGTGKADTVVKLYTGLGTRDTHAVINNLRWGFDGWIYATHGYSMSDHVTSGDGAKDFGRIGSGVIRFKPDGSAIEQYSSKGGNTWGLAVTPENRIVWTQPTSGDLVMETVLPESVLSRGKVGETTSYKVITKSGKTFPLMTWEQQAYRQIDFVGSFTAAAGCAIYDGGTWPAKWNGSYFTGEPTINIVHHEFFRPEGVSLAGDKEAGREETEFIRSKDMWFRPIEEKIGPDGALYVVDFYNQAVIHNDTRGPVHNEVNAAVRPDRDHYFSRVWRVNHQQAAALPVPDLTAAAPAALLAALDSPNRAVRFTAQRLLVEEASPEATAPLRALVADRQRPAPARLHALWTLQQLAQLDEPTLLGALREGDAVLAQNALKIAAERPSLGAEATAALAHRLQDPDPRTQLAALVALGAAEPTPEICRALLAVVPSLKDPYLQSAALAGASRAPGEYLAAALQEPEETTAALAAFLGQLAHLTASQPQAAAKLLASLSSPQIPAARALPILLGLSEESRTAKAPAWTPELQAAFTHIFERPELQGAAVPLALAWDREGTLRPAITALVGPLLRQITEVSLPEPVRARLVTTLASARSLSPEILPALARLLGTEAPATLQKHALAAIGETDDGASGAALVAAYPRLTPVLQSEAFAQILKRASWTQLFLEQLKAGNIPLTSVGTIASDKLRHHPSAPIARLAGETLDLLRGPVTQQKDQAIAKLLPVVEAGGDPVKGKALFLSTCAVCHHFNGEGANLAPDLTGMGAHPRAELLTSIVDPNREVDPSFIAWDFQMQNGETFQGIIARENARTVLVRDAAGEHTLEKKLIAGRHELGRSLMPEGFEALGAETLRDIVAYLQSGDARFRVLDLRAACTADSSGAIFTEGHATQTLMFKKFGDVRVGDVPFKILDPRTVGKNLIILKGGQAPLSKSYPRRVEISAGHADANVLEILGGVGGWAFPCCGDEKGDGLPVVKLIVQYDGGATEELELKNGVEFADYLRPHDVPGSKNASELVSGQQVRIIRKALTKGGPINKIILESYDNRVAPVFVAITAEKTDARGPATVSAK